jgi:hypothetical protein
VLSRPSQQDDLALLQRLLWVCDENPCEDCEANQDAGPIPNDEEFPSGDMAEIAHNGYKCHTESVVKDSKDDDDDD